MSHTDKPTDTAGKLEPVMGDPIFESPKVAPPRGTAFDPHLSTDFTSAASSDNE